MGKILYLECNSGISGDMTVGALLDLGADRQVMEDALNSLGVGGYHLHFGRAVKHGIDAFDFDVHLEESGTEHGVHDHGEEEHMHGGHSHVHEDQMNEDHCHGQEEYVHGDQSHVHEDHSHTHEDHSHTHEDHSHIHEDHNHMYEDHNHMHEDHSHTHEDHSHTHVDHDHAHDFAHSHVHRNLYDICEIINRMDANDRVKAMARRMFEIVAEAESKAHGLPVDQVHFHEVGAIDSIVDLIGVAVCIDNLGVDEIVVSPLSEGRGHIRCQHGILPVPVPATANIAAAYGLELRLTDNEGEMVTPTGAAIAAAVRTRKELPASCRILKIGIGAGKREYKQSNILRAMLLETEETAEDSMWVLESNLDDCTGENLGFAMECLFRAGAADVWYTPIYMKKNRPAYMLSVLCREDLIERMEEVILIQTTTIGIRRHQVMRTVADRTVESFDTSLGKADVKICRYQGRVFCYPEYESVKAVCEEQNLDFQSVYVKIREEASKVVS